MELEKSTAPKASGRTSRLTPKKPNAKFPRSLGAFPAATNSLKAKFVAPTLWHPPRGASNAVLSGLSLRPVGPVKRTKMGPTSALPHGVPSAFQSPSPLSTERRRLDDGTARQWENVQLRVGNKRAAAQRMTGVAETEAEAEDELSEAALSTIPSESLSMNSSINDGERAKHATGSMHDIDPGFPANAGANFDETERCDNSSTWPSRTNCEGFPACEKMFVENKEDADALSPENPTEYDTPELNGHTTSLKTEKPPRKLSSKLTRSSQAFSPYIFSTCFVQEQHKFNEGGYEDQSHRVGQQNGVNNETDTTKGNLSHLTRNYSPRLWSKATLSLQDGLSAATCEAMSLYNAFYYDKYSGMWTVNKAVLKRCFDFVGLMGYECPLPDSPFSRLSPRSENEVAEFLSGAVLSPSPIVRNIPTTISSTPTSCVGSKGGIRQNWSLTHAASSIPFSKGRHALIFSGIETERWLSEQEYVIGAILSCCAWSQTNVNEPYLVPDWHPIQQAAAFVTDRFPHWGDVSGFVDIWEKQVGLVLGTAAPAHQRQFAFPADGITFSSDMEGGNLARVERGVDVESHPAFDLWMDSDMGCEQRLWFRFAIAGVRPGGPVYLRIGNIQPNTKLYLRNGMRPVWRAANSKNQWTPVAECAYRTVNDGADGEIAFAIVPQTVDVIHVAFCVPYTYGDLLCHISHWHNLVKRSAFGIRFEERVLCYTQDGRKLHLLVITSLSSKNTSTRVRRRRNEGLQGFHQGCFSPYTNFEAGKKVVLLSGRVHPGEVTASHGIHGAITFLLSSDPCASLLRDHFVFYVVPMLNPDGVSRGHSRLDQNGLNLNRCYSKPNPLMQPTVNALRNVFEHLRQTFRERFFMYIDFHSHASQSTGFIFGNFLPAAVQHWNMVFPKIVSIHAKDVFSYQSCRFGRGHMTSKEGSSRVLFGGVLIHSYTVELTHFTNNRMFVDGSADKNTGTDAAAEEDNRWEAKYANTIGSRRRCGTDSGNRLRFCRVRQRPRPQRLSSTMGSGGKARGTHAAADSGEPDVLRVIDTPCILSQSAEVGRACLMALLDYCAIAPRASPVFLAYGGMEKALREVRRQTGTQGTTRPEPYASQSNFKQ